MDQFLKNIYEKVKIAQEFALGYPVNRRHALNINLEDLGIIKNSLSDMFVNNVGSPYTAKNFRVDDIRELEQYVINTVFSHLGSDQDNAFGYVTSGGTEANFAAIWWHREYLANKYHEQPLLLASNKSHYSLDKIANQLQLKLVKFDGDNLVESLQSFLKSNNDKPMIFWANVGSTVDGTIDNLEQIKSTLESSIKNKYKIHADGAIYGFLIPYINTLKHIKNIFTIIDSISISGHKFLGAYNVCGIILTNRTYIENVFGLQNRAITYVRNAIDYTVSGSRPGMHIVELYLLLKQALIINKDGKTNLESLWNQCLETAHWFYSELKNIVTDNDLLWFKPYQLSVLMPAPKQEQIKFDISKKYALMPAGSNQLGIYILPRSTKDKLKIFLKDYKKCGEFYRTK